MMGQLILPKPTRASFCLRNQLEMKRGPGWIFIEKHSALWPWLHGMGGSQPEGAPSLDLSRDAWGLKVRGHSPRRGHWRRPVVRISWVAPL